MPADSSLFAHVEKNYQFFVFMFSTLVLCMGVAHWAGKWHGYNKETSRRKKLGLPVPSLFSQDGNSQQAFTYTALFNGGLVGIAIIVAVFLYRILGAAFFSAIGIGSDLSNLVFGATMLVMGVVVKGVANLLSDNRITRSFAVIALSIGFLSFAGLSSPDLAEPVLKFVESFIPLETRTITIRAFCATVLALWLSYSIGFWRGNFAVDPEINYPLVDVRVLRGDDFTGVWLYEQTRSDYRVLTKAGLSHIIPLSNVKEIKALTMDGPHQLEEQ